MNKVIIIAEAGVNHNGDINLALNLIDAAANAGADYVKFQTFKAENIVSKKAKKAQYQEANFQDGTSSQFEMLQKLEMADDWYPFLINHCKEKGIRFLSTGFDTESINFLQEFNIPFFKIPSGEITNKPYLQHIARMGKSIILSTGMSNISEIKDALEVLENEGIKRKNITVLHCNTDYPTKMVDVNLLAMNHIAKELNVNIGYSDHTLGIEVAIAAVALGAKVIEKHFTLDRNLPGPDHSASLDPSELKEMVKSIRNIELAISGSGIKEPSLGESINLVSARKSLHLKVDLKEGTILSAEHLSSLRPGDGISPMEINNVIGKKLSGDKLQGDKLLWKDLL